MNIFKRKIHTTELPSKSFNSLANLINVTFRPNQFEETSHTILMAFTEGKIKSKEFDYLHKTLRDKLDGIIKHL